MPLRQPRRRFVARFVNLLVRTRKIAIPLTMLGLIGCNVREVKRESMPSRPAVEEIGSVQRDSLELYPTPVKSFLAEFEKAKKDTLHVSSETRLSKRSKAQSQNLFFGDKVNKPFKEGISVGILADDRCTKCHNIQDLATTEQERIQGWKEKIKKAYGIDWDVHNTIFVFIPTNETKLGLAVTENAGNCVKFQVPFIANSALRDLVVPHELIHLFALPDGYIHERWAHISPFLINPSFVNHTFSGEPFFLANYFNRDFIQRVAVLKARGKAPEHFFAPPSSSENVGSVIDRTRRGLNRRDVAQASKIYREAFHEYRKNNLFWDTVSTKYSDHNLVVDALIARNLYSSDEEYRTLVASDRIKRISERFLAKHGVDLSRQPPFNIDFVSGEEDRRSLLHRFLEEERGNPGENRVWLYYATLYSHLFDSDGEIKHADNKVARVSELEAHSRAKIETLEDACKTAEEIRQTMLDSEPNATGVIHYSRVISERIGVLRNRIQEIKRELATLSAGRTK